MARVLVSLGRSLVLWLLLCASAVADEQGLLWHISGKGADGYLFGTMHSDDPRITALPAVVERHFDSAGTLMLELSLDAETQMGVAMAMMLPPQQRLSDVVGDELGQQAVVAMQEYGIPAAATQRMQPWAVFVTLSMPQQQSAQILDVVLYQRAKQQQKRFVPLESVEEQLAVFTALSLDEQIALLRNVLQEYKSYPQLFAQMTEAYLRRDLAAIMKIGERNPMSHEPALQRKLMASLLEQRNRRMVPRIESQLKEGKLFVAVGAMHLSGEEGLIRLLRQRGYRVDMAY